MQTPKFTKEKIADAAAQFWGVITNSFPEMTTGDSQISGEDHGAIGLWANGDNGDEPTMKYRLQVPSYIAKGRINDSVTAGIDAAGAELFGEGQRPPVSPEVVDQLQLCVRHVLSLNLPERKPRAKVRP